IDVTNIGFDMLSILDAKSGLPDVVGDDRRVAPAQRRDRLGQVDHAATRPGPVVHGRRMAILASLEAVDREKRAIRPIAARVLHAGLELGVATQEAGQQLQPLELRWAEALRAMLGLAVEHGLIAGGLAPPVADLGLAAERRLGPTAEVTVGLVLSGRVQTILVEIERTIRWLAGLGLCLALCLALRSIAG